MRKAGALAGLSRAELMAAIDPITVLDISDDFMVGIATTGNIGALGWQFTNGTVAGIAGEANHPGILRRTTSATINTIASLRHLISVATQLLASAMFDMTWVFRLNTNDTDTVVQLGLSQSHATTTPVEAIYLEKKAADTSWFGTVRIASVETRTAALAAIDTDWHKVRIRRIDASTVGFTLDGGAEVAIACSGAGTMTAGLLLTNIAAADKTMDLDAYRLRITNIAR